jgi:hypothetical protein
MVLRLGQTLGPLVMGAIYGLKGLNWAFYGGAVLALLTLVLLSFTVVGRVQEDSGGVGPEPRLE